MAAAAVALTVWLVRRTSSDPLRAVPASSFLVLSIDFESLRASPLFKVAFGEDGARTFGFPSFAQSCGFDPLDRAAQVHLAVPEGGDQGDFGVVATGEVTADELVGCGQKLVGGDGPAPAMRDQGSFKLFVDEKSGLRVAFRRGGPALGGRGRWIETMMAAAEGREASIATNAAHRNMRDKLGASTVVLTAVLPHALRNRLRNEWLTQDDESAPQNLPIAGVLGVDTVALSLDAGSSARPAALAVDVGCESASACGQVKKLLERKRFEWGKELGLRLVGVGTLLDALTFESSPNGSGLHIAASLPAEEVAGVLARVLKLRKERHTSPATDRPRPPSLRPDEQLTTSRDGGRSPDAPAAQPP
jgi:hypothetical protein